eukprot:scaffold14632_cov22-Cyclotella_meneghiniana.AAC.2
MKSSKAQFKLHASIYLDKTKLWSSTRCTSPFCLAHPSIFRQRRRAANRSAGGGWRQSRRRAPNGGVASQVQASYEIADCGGNGLVGVMADGQWPALIARPGWGVSTSWSRWLEGI